jgi:hypothetical protein
MTASFRYGLLAALITSVGLLTAADPARAVTYSVSGTAINSPDIGVSFSFTLTTPNVITSFADFSAAQLSSCSIGSAAYGCNGVTFRPAEVKDFPNTGDAWDQIDFGWFNTDLSGGGSAQLLFALGAFTTPGTYDVGPISLSDDAVLTLTAEVPLPAALPLFASALMGGGVLAWRKRRQTKANRV